MNLEGWRQFKGREVPATTPISERFLELIHPGARVIEVGCGYGRLAEALQGRGAKVSGVDINESAIEMARDTPELAGIDFSVQDARQMDFGPESFDAATLQGVIATMNPEDRLAVLQEVRRVLTPQGILHLAEFAQTDDRRERYERDVAQTGEYGTIIVRDDMEREMFRTHQFAKEELEQLSLQAGFTVLSYESRSFPTIKGKLQAGHLLILGKSRDWQRIRG